MNWKYLPHFTACFIGCLLVRLFLMHLLLHHAGVVNMDIHTHRQIVDNVKAFFKYEFATWHPDNLTNVNAGMLMACFFLWPKTREERGMYLVIVLFFIFITMVPLAAARACYEYRQFEDALILMAFYLFKKIEPSAIESRLQTA